MKLPALVAVLALSLAPWAAGAQPARDFEVVLEPPRRILPALELGQVSAAAPAWQPWDRTTLAIQAGLGAGAWVAGLAVGAGLGAGLGYGMAGFDVRTDDQRAAIGTLAAMLGVVGAFFGLPAGVWFGGDLEGGNGSYWATLAGELLGGMVGSSIASAAFLPTQGGALSTGSYVGFAALSALFWVAGAEVGYHLSAH